MLNPFKKRKKTDKVAEAEGRKEAGKEAKIEKVVRAGSERKIVGVIISPHITEKSMASGGLGWYSFRVASGATKREVRAAVEDRYGVAVKKVRVSNQRAKEIRIGRISGRSGGFKKVMVKLAEGQSIEVT